MSVLTILNHGTGFRREKPSEMIADFGRNLAGREIRPENPDGNGELEGDYLICDGPGSGNSEENPLPGTFNVYTGAPKGSTGWKLGLSRKPKHEKFTQEFYGETPKRSNLGGNLAGHGWSDNVTKIVYTLSALKALPTTINMAGWSRGAVTCIMAANKIYELFPQIEVNIFAIDPVPGFGNNEFSKFFDKRRSLPPSVRNFVALLALHEKRRFFDPVDASKIRINPRSEGINVLFLPMPGKHSAQSVMQDKDDESSRLNLAWKITYHLGYKFLKQHGTHFNMGYDSSRPANAILDMYSEMLLNWDEIKSALKSQGLKDRAMGGFHKRSFSSAKELQRYTMHSNYFVNEHHRALFKLLHREVYDVLFSRTGNGYNTTKIRGAMAQLSSTTFKTLAPFCSMQNCMTQGQQYLPNPGSGVDNNLQPLPYSQWPGTWQL